MNILKESKEKLPVDLLAGLISKGWDEVAVLKAQIDGVKSSFTGAKVVVDILQDLSDAYLLTIGQLENLLSKEGYDTSEQVKESLTEAKKKDDDKDDEDEESDKEEKDDDKIADAPAKVTKQNDGKKVELHTELPDYNVEVEQKGKKVEVEVEPKDTFDDSKLAMSDKDVEFVNKPFDDEWPTPEPDNGEMAAARAALANGSITIGPDIAPMPTAPTNETATIDDTADFERAKKPIETTVDGYFVDFDEPEEDDEKRSMISDWLNHINH